MKTAVKELTVEAFSKYGSFANLVAPEGPHLGQAPCTFFRDMGVVTLNATRAGISVTRVEKRQLVIDELEYHDGSGEVNVPLDGDIYMQVAPAGPHGYVNPEDIEVFHVKKGTAVIINPGVWHCGPFCTGEDPVDILVVLPERTYATDCSTIKLAPAVEIEVK